MSRRAQAASLAGWLLLGGCSSSLEKLDEAVVLERPDMTLKVVHYHESVPLSYEGDRYSVFCRSPRTEAAYARADREPGWRPLGELAHDNERLPARAFVETVRDDYRMHGTGVMSWSAIAFNVTWDACGRVAVWDPSRLPPVFIDPVAKPDYCRPVGSGDCRYHDFQNDRRPRYALHAVTPSGHVDFGVRTAALTRGMQVSTETAGRVWHVVPGATEPERAYSVESLQRLDAATIDDRIRPTLLRQWFDTALPAAAGAMVVWSPDRLECAGRAAGDRAAAVPTCVALSVTNKWGDEARLVLWRSSAGTGWHSGEIVREGTVLAVDGLADLPGAIRRAEP
ncbi:MAG: hypothetical protein RIC56_17615 [Pseudomonadales bacterium]